MSDPKPPQTFEDWCRDGEVDANVGLIGIARIAWDAAQAALRDRMEQEKAVVVAAAEEATILELLGDAHTLCRVSNWTEDGDCDVGDVVASEAQVDRKTGALARALDQARAEATKAVQASLEGQARETARIAAREKALRERLVGLPDTWVAHCGKNSFSAGTTTLVEDWLRSRLRALLEETEHG